MKPTTIPTLALTALTAFTLAPALRAEDAKPINPALLYWQAAAQLSPLNSDQAKELRAVALGQHPIDAAITKILADSESALRLARKAADSPAPCDWGLPLEDGPFMALPHAAKMQEIANLAIAQAEAAFAGGKAKEGLDELLLAHRLARHAGAGDLLISNLVQFAIETNALRCAGRHCLGWDDDTRRSYAAALRALPPLHTTQAAYGGERVFVDWLERRFNEGGLSAQEIAELTTGLGQNDEKGKAWDQAAIAAQFTRAAMVPAVAELRSLQGRAQVAFGKPWAQCEAELNAVSEEAQHSAHLIVRTTFPEGINLAKKQFTVATLRTMLDAALAHGPQLDEAAAATYRDAFEGEPLLWKKNDDGTLSLLAAHQHRAAKDLVLQLGK